MLKHLKSIVMLELIRKIESYIFVLKQGAARTALEIENHSRHTIIIYLYPIYPSHMRGFPRNFENKIEEEEETNFKTQYALCKCR